jgi:hypothetical protein
MSLVKVGFSLLKSVLKSKPAKNVVTQVAKKAEKLVPKTKVFTDSSAGITKMEREITYAGKKALASVEIFPNGTRKLHISGGGDNPLWRTTKITKTPKSNVFGGDQIVVDKKTTKYWCHEEKQTLTKQYSPNGVLEHKELNFAHSSGNGLNDYKHFATQDKLYNEVNLTSSAKDMYKTKPKDNRNIMHYLDGETNYELDRIPKYEKAKIDTAKSTKEEAIAAKKTAEEAATKLKAEAPKLNTGKILGRDLSSLKKTEIPCKNGKTIRLYKDPETNKLLVKTEDQGIKHQEWFYGGKADKIYLNQIGDKKPYIIAKKGNYTQIYGSPTEYQNEFENFLLYKGEDASLKWELRNFIDKNNRYVESPYNPSGILKTNNEAVKVNKGNLAYKRDYKSTPEERIASKVLQNVTENAKSKVLNIYELLSDYV